MRTSKVRNWLSARLLTVALVVLMLLCGGLMALRWSTQRSHDSTVATLTVLLRSDREEVRAAAAIQLRDIGHGGIAPLVQALTDREEIFTLACQSIDSAIAKWQFLPPDEANDRLNVLVTELDQVIDGLPKERRFVARRWAEQIILWPGMSVDTTELLSRCESILRQSPVFTEVNENRQHESLIAAQRSIESETADSARERLQPPLVYTEPPTPEETIAPTPPFQSPLAPGFVAIAPPLADIAIDSKEAEEPQRLVSPTAKPLVSREFNLTRSKALAVESVPIDEIAALREQSDLNVMHKLHDLDSSLAKAAESELRRRGYRTADISICQKLVHPDPQVRGRLAESLPKMHNVDARPWLLQLSQDANADVRRTADGILRTSRDPAIKERFR